MHRPFPLTALHEFDQKGHRIRIDRIQHLVDALGPKSFHA